MSVPRDPSPGGAAASSLRDGIDPYSYLAEKSRALQLWADEVLVEEIRAAA